jgi:DNA-binding beta-propeller fold protein YncE
MRVSIRFWAALAVCVMLCAAAAFAKSEKSPAGATLAPVSLDLEGGRRLEFVRAFSSERDLNKKKSFWTRLVDVVVGAPDVHGMIHPYGVATDSQGRIIVTDPGSRSVHIFDFAKQKYRLIEGGKEEFKSPIGVAVDDHDNIYVSDSELGKIFVFDSRGKFRRYFGDIKGEGYFKRPTGLAVDSAARRLYVTDTLKDEVYTLDLDGNILGHFGKRGDGDGEFNYPTDIAVRGNELIVVDAMNFRVQIFGRDGSFRAKFGKPGDVTGYMFRSKGIALDSEGDFYVVDALFDCVQVFNRAGDLLYYFGGRGKKAMQFELPSGIHISRDDMVYVVDSENRRVEVFRYTAAHAGVGLGVGQ